TLERHRTHSSIRPIIGIVLSKEDLQAPAGERAVGWALCRHDDLKRKEPNNVEHHPVSPRAACFPREGLSRIPRPGRDGQVAPAEWIYRQGSPLGRQSRRYLSDVIHEFHYGS